MYREYFVLVTETVYGVFSIAEKDYPMVFLNNLNHVVCLTDSEIDAYLLKKVGRNSLSKNKFKWYLDLGKVFYL